MRLVIEYSTIVFTLHTTTRLRFTPLSSGPARIVQRAIFVLRYCEREEASTRTENAGVDVCVCV